jgi:hypothetical protein
MLEAAAASMTDECIHFRTYRSSVKFAGTQMNATRAVWTIAHGAPGDLFVLHTCHNETCINVRHLYLGDHQQNMDDRFATGHYGRGSKCPVSKLTEDQVVELLRLRREGRLLTELAEQFGVHYSTVSQIARRKTWRHLD